jgi:hypothetical protein
MMIACRAGSHNISSPFLKLLLCTQSPGRECSNNQFQACLLSEKVPKILHTNCRTLYVSRSGFEGDRLVSSTRERVKVLEDEEVSELSHVLVCS